MLININIMGQSSSSEAKSLMEVVNTTITNISESSTAAGNAVTKNINSLKLTFGPNSDITGCDLNVSQANTSDQKVTVSNIMTSQTDLTTTLSTELTNKVDQLTTQQQEALSLGMNCSNTVSDIQTNVTNFVQNNISKSAASSVKAFVNQLNKGVFEFNGKYTCGPDGKLNFDQSNITNQIVELVASSLFNSEIGVAIGTAADNSSKQDTDQKLEGLGGVMKSLMALVGGGMIGGLLLMMCPCIVLICCVFLCCRGRGKKGAFGKKKNSL